MRLLNSHTLELHEYWGRNIPRYAILSHTWGDEEVSFQDVKEGSMKAKAGYKKIEYACMQAKMDDYGYCWVDTCCIDKTSSAELSEAINSMYNWYKNATVCYAFLPDVAASSAGNDIAPDGFAESRWFTRGWTLQELIAPSTVIFYGMSWAKLGTKSTLRDEVSAITGIDARILDGHDPGTTSIARRMFWASNRQTTREEDMAYCLMGIFDINMPLLYGEGEKAFIRLQEEIMKASDDHSLFAWISSPDERYVYRGLLAKSPAEFKDSRDIVPIRNSKVDSSSYSLTNKGLRIDLELYEHGVAFLECRILRRPDGSGKTGRFRIQLEALTEDKQYARKWSNELYIDEEPSKSTGTVKTVYVRQKILISVPSSPDGQQRISLFNNLIGGYTITKSYPQGRWSESALMLTFPSEVESESGVLVYTQKGKVNVVLKLGIDLYNGPWYELIKEKRSFEIDDELEITVEGSWGTVSMSLEDETPVFFVIFASKHRPPDMIQDNDQSQVTFGVEDLKLAREDGHDGIVNLLESLSRSVKDLSENYEATKLLWWAVMKEKHDLLEALVQKGADLNSEKQFTYPRTPLGWAVENDRRDMFFHLSLLGADPCQNNWRDDTAISLAMEKQRTNWVTSMLESVPNLDILINREHYILTYAASKRNCEVIEWLLDNGASVDVRSSVGLTALSYVAQTGDVQTAKLLLDHGADLESRGGYVNRTPLEWASERLMKDFLVKRSADKGATDKYNMGAY